jgi:hypothetical protein
VRLRAFSHACQLFVDLFFWKMPIKSMVCFNNQIIWVFFFLFSYLSFLHIWILTLHQMYSFQTFSLISRLFFHLIDGFLCWVKIFSFMKSHLSTFTFVSYSVGILSKNSCLFQNPEIPSRFPLRGFIVSGPIFKH